MAFRAVVAILALSALTTASPVVREAEFGVQIETDNQKSPEVEQAIQFLNQNSLKIQKYVAAAIAQIPEDAATDADRLDSLLNNLYTELEKSIFVVAKQAQDAVKVIQDDLAARKEAIENAVNQRRVELDAKAAELVAEHEKTSAEQRAQLKNESAELRAQLEAELAEKASQLEASLSAEAEQLKKDAEDLDAQHEEYANQRHNDLAELKSNIHSDIHTEAKKTQQQITRVRDFIQNGLLEISTTVNNNIAFKVSGTRTEVNNAITPLNKSFNNKSLNDVIAQTIAANKGKEIKLKDLLSQLANQSPKAEAGNIHTILSNLSGTFATVASSSTQNHLNSSIKL